MEVEGVEPSSNHGTNKLSTCLAIELIFVDRQARGNQSDSYPLKFQFPDEENGNQFPNFLAPPYPNVSERGNGVMSRQRHFGADKANLLCFG